MYLYQATVICMCQVHDHALEGMKHSLVDIPSFSFWFCFLIIKHVKYYLQLQSRIQGIYINLVIFPHLFHTMEFVPKMIK